MPSDAQILNQHIFDRLTRSRYDDMSEEEAAEALARDFLVAAAEYFDKYGTTPPKISEQIPTEELNKLLDRQPGD